MNVHPLSLLVRSVKCVQELKRIKTVETVDGERSPSAQVGDDVAIHISMSESLGVGKLFAGLDTGGRVWREDLQFVDCKPAQLGETLRRDD